MKDLWFRAFSADFIKHFGWSRSWHGVNTDMIIPWVDLSLCAGSFLYIFVRSLRQKQFLIFIFSLLLAGFPGG